jgi:hypothetical protein
MHDRQNRCIPGKIADDEASLQRCAGALGEDAIATRWLRGIWRILAPEKKAIDYPWAIKRGNRKSQINAGVQVKIIHIIYIYTVNICKWGVFNCHV